MWPKAVIFDMDGVLIDARNWHYEALNEGLALFGAEIPYQEHLDRFDGLPTRVKLKLLSAEGRLEEHLHDLVEEVKQERTLRIAASKNLPNLDHLILIGRLKHMGLKVGVATNSIRLTSQFMLESAGLLGELDCLVTNEDVIRGKPDPEIYVKSCNLLGLRPQECVAIEDSPNGIRSAESAGLKVVSVASPDDVGVSLLEKIKSRGQTKEVDFE